MIAAEKFLENILKRVDQVITQNHVSVVVAVQTKQLPPTKFVQKYYRKEIVLLHRFSETHIKVIIEMFFKVTNDILKDLNFKQLDFAPLNRLCIYYALAASCVNSREINEKEEVADDDICQTLMQQASNIFSTNFGKFTNFVEHHFSLFLSAIGSHSKHIYSFFLSRLQSDFMAAKRLPQMLRPWAYMSSSVKYVHNSLGPISLILADTPKQCMEPFCEMMLSTVLMSLKQDVDSFISFLDEKSYIESARNIVNIITPWGDKHFSFVWPIQIILEMLDPSKLSSFNYDDQKSFHGRLTRVAKLKSAKKDAAVASLYSAFRALALSNCHPILADFMSHFYPSFLQYYLGSKRDFKNPDQLKMAYVDFPICVLMLHTDDFNSKILPIISNEKKPDYWQYFAKLVRRVCKQSQSKISNLDFLDALIDPVMSIFKRAEKNQTAAQCIVHIMSGFQYSPYFFRMVLAKQPENIDLIINRIKADESLTPQYALLNLFDPKDIEIADFSGNIEIITKLLQFLTETYQKITLYKTNTFADSIPNVILQIAEFLHLYFQSNNNNIEPDIISYLESSAIMFLASSQKELRLYGVSIISSILEIVHNIESIDFPIDSYQKLLFEARRTPILTTAHNSIKNGLREIPKATKGISKSFETLFPYFLALTKAINPNIELIKQPENVLQPKDYDLQEEWVGTTSIMLSITFNEIQDIISQIRILLNDDGDLGACVVSAIPTAINIKHFNFIIQNANEWLSLLHDENNYFEVNSKNMNFIANLMKMLRGLTDQKQWKPNNINEEHFSNIMSTIVSYCDLIPGETLRLSCVQCLISMITLLNTHKKKIQSVIRHQTGKTLLGWIPTTKDTENLSKQYISKIHQALSLLLDDLNLLDCIDPNDPNTPEEQATEQFMLYFASIKNRLDSTETDESDMIPVLASLLKQNLSIGIEHCISMGFAENDNVRAVFIAALAAVFKVPDVKVVENEKTSDTLIDTIFTGDWSFVEYVCSCIPYSRAEAFGAAMVESAMLRGIEYEYLEKMISVEVETCDEASKNTLFRGNAVPARAVGHFPRLVGTQWMTQTLRPVFEKVITNCDKGIRYEVNPAKIGDGNLEQNQENFRNLLNEFIQVILAAREKMPPSLVIESKLIYKKVSEKYGDFAIQILSGFLFLRFLLPAFNVPKLVGLPEMLPAIPRAALLSISTVLMAATLRGRLNEKGQFYIPFNDVAQYANDSFREMFLQIVETEVNEQPKEDEVLKTLNEETEINVLHAELYSVLPQLTNGITEMEEDNPVRVQTESLIAKIHSMGEPTNKKQNKKQTILEEESSASGSNQGQKQLEQLLTMEFTEDQIQEIHDFIIHDKNNAPDGSSIYYVYFEKLKNIKDIRIKV
ncbi:GTPase-activator protein [Histomonas meleagridis]|uniref:GTPase-activator protein n=1 Tax=Histomonas meleagridis TaxID=135588 RepID=UPI00355ABBE5|nr:GTPase-activator protein [Histomonas meleagridis]KAH0796122.1 GTPase-activator protein [Histomonas meleagridis]